MGKGRRRPVAPTTTRRSRQPSKRSAPLPAQVRICDKCGAENVIGALACSACQSKRFAPPWVRQLRRVNRSVAVQITEPHPLSETDEPVLSLYKWWPGGTRTFNVPSAAQWDGIQRAVAELAPYLRWEVHEELARTLDDRAGHRDTLDASLQQLMRQDPSVLQRLVEGLDLTAMPVERIGELTTTLTNLGHALAGADQRLLIAIESVVKKLPAQGSKAVEGLSELMEQLTLSQITAVTVEVQRRMNLLELFKQRMLDERTYEIRGDGSIHRLLEQAMWIVDEHYWLMHSNEALRTLVGEHMAKEDKRYERARPDFVCGTVDRRLVIIEIKRPSHTLDVPDLNQLERYLVLCSKYDTGHKSINAYLVGQRQTDDLRNTLKFRQGLHVRTYSDLLADTERRYKDYLNAFGKRVAS